MASGQGEVGRMDKEGQRLHYDRERPSLQVCAVRHREYNVNSDTLALPGGSTLALLVALYTDFFKVQHGGEMCWGKKIMIIF